MGTDWGVVCRGVCSGRLAVLHTWDRAGMPHWLGLASPSCGVLRPGTGERVRAACSGRFKAEALEIRALGTGMWGR